MPLYSYVCSRGHTTELLRNMSVEVVCCTVCDSPAPRSPANRIAITAPTIDSRGMFRRYSEASAEIDYAASKEEARTGQTVQTPDLWSAAKARAAAIERAGEHPLPHNGRST